MIKQCNSLLHEPLGLNYEKFRLLNSLTTKKSNSMNNIYIVLTFKYHTLSIDNVWYTVKGSGSLAEVH